MGRVTSPEGRASLEPGAEMPVSVVATWWNLETCSCFQNDPVPSAVALTQIRLPHLRASELGIIIAKPLWHFLCTWHLEALCVQLS